MKQVSIEKIAEEVSGHIVNQELLREDINWKYNNISIDSRTIAENDIFIPIKGDNFDGHNFISMAYEKGAMICFTEDKSRIPSNQIGILVSDTKKALKDFAKYYLSLFKIPIVAVTGSVGKTSCKEMIGSILSVKYDVHKTIGNFNNEIGLPLTIFKLEDRHEVVVLEMGMNHYGELHRLSEIARPDIAVITNIGEAHIEYFGTKNNILKAKSEILDFLKKDGLVILNGDDPYLRKLKENIPFNTLTFGFNDDNDYYISDYKELGWDGLIGKITGTHEEYNIKIHTLGKHMLYNIIPGIIIGNHLNMTANEIEQGAYSYKPSKMRMDRIELNDNIVVINDAYNASVDSMISALDTLSTLDTQGRKVAVLGDMFELGDMSKDTHTRIGKVAATKNIDFIICVGKDSKYIYEGAMSNGIDKNKISYYKTKEELIDDIDELVKAKDTIIIKASRGMHLEKVIERLQSIFK
ncbi:UDP-N-acetylmuramoyl-tripeptide--D-alanyl-D-alanine ligase [Vallitalea longa]|uniref:UDP-N-acetylmuramoyl-tripeptide--D-alanyl-D-alanine ligase n=1 Tax=Vallitalea longa TaxID=2936439 RepID=A0A9W5YB09_9FIRM|nr:UDP-N-acetylmuramoyl-tripeptide--D-alanyl-D-alanine ligase [Vallitalea longa]GKX29078.1 UDP-N-acetylmuramoyl-tripeptide--D-alanyl-D-alanine ligase [Vallitalea longa]